MRRVISFILTLVMLIGMMPLVATAETEMPYKSVQLEINWANIKAVGKQAAGSQSCACFALAYARTLLDGKVHDYSEYNVNTNQYDAIASWQAGSYTGHYPNNKTDAYRRVYSELCTGNPVIVKVKGSRSSHHYVTIVGFENVTTLDSLSAANFLIIDPGVSGYAVENLGKVGYDLKYEQSNYQVLTDTSSKTVAFTSIAANSYVAKECTFYPAYGTIKITEACNPYTLPCNSETAKEYDCESTALTEKKLKVGDEVAVNGIVLNSEENYWYKVTLSDGTSAWVFCERAKGMTTKNPHVSGSIVPDSISGSQALSGTIVNGGAKLETVWAEVHDANGNKKISSNKISVSTTSNYALNGTAVDNSLVFGDLKQYGNATYKLYIKAEVTYSWLDKNNKLQTKTKEEIQLGSDTFNFTTSGGSSGNTSTTYTVTFQPNGGTCATSTLSVTAGKAIGALPDADFGGMEFVGWYTKAYVGTEITASTVPTGNMTLWAHYKNPQYPQKLNFDPNGGAFPEPVLTNTITGVNMGRPTDSLVVFNQSGAKSGTNEYGTEVAVNSVGKVTAVRRYGSTTQLTVPDGGFVLSGHQIGSTFVGKILDINEAYIHLNYETGEVRVFDSYAGYLAETKRGEEYATLGVLPVPTRDGYVFRGWCDSNGNRVDYYSSFAGTDYTAEWDKKTELYPEATLEYNGHYYELYDYNVSWTEAKTLCESMGGYLVSITDAAEQTQIAALTAKGDRGMYRIGATDAGSEGTWKWVSGEAFSYSNWDKNTPEPNGAENENYCNLIAIENPPNKQAGEWIDDYDIAHGNFYDMSNTGFICEYNQLPACAHKYQSVVTKATCTDGGYTTHTCTLCGDSYADTHVAALGHSWKDANCTTAKTCKTCGATEGTALGHSWNNANCTTAKTCKTCGATEGTALGHSWKDANCTTAKTCKTCGATEGTALGHSWKDANCTTAKTCKTCGATEGTALGHSWKDANCTTAKTCKTCGATEGTALGHSWKDANCTTAKTCKTCGATEGTALGHSWKDADCTTAMTCRTCGATEGSALGHNYQNGICTQCKKGEHGQEIIATGTCGDDLQWVLDSEGVLTIFGAGKMTDFVPATLAWADYLADIRHVVVCDGATSIGDRAFLDCTGLETVEIADTVTDIGIWAFARCENLTEVDTGDGVAKIDSQAFDGCTALTSVTLGAEVTKIESFAFRNCESLRSITWPQTLTRIAASAFQNCKSLEKVDLPEKLDTLQSGAFWGCNNLKEINIPESNIAYCSVNGVLYSENKTTLIAVPGGIEDIFAIPEGVTIIGEDAFAGCESITEVILPDTIGSINSNAFNGCRGLTEIVIPENVWCIKTKAFGNCVNLRKIKFLGSVPTRFIDSAFENVTATVYYHADNTTWTADAMNQYGGTLTWVAISACDDGHAYESTPKEATCTEQGYTSYTCSVCGETNIGDYVDARGHDMGNWETTKETSCTENGLKQKNCSRCDYSEMEDIPAIGHSYDDIVTPPTCTSQGYTTHTCSVCGYATQDTYLDKVPHTEVIDAEVPATCTATGLTVGIHCSACGEVVKEQEIVPANGHTPGEIKVENIVAPDCETDGSHDEATYCTICEAEISRINKDDPPSGHTEVEIPAKAPTCVETGLTTGTKCSVCGEILSAQQSVDAQGHTEVVDAAVESTCTATGLTEGSHCSACNTVIVVQAEVPMKSHEMTITRVDQPTCTEAGNQVVECANCDYETSETLDPKGHTEVVDKAVETTCTETGKTEGKHCEVCGEVIVAQQDIPATGHTYTDDQDTSCNVCGYERTLVSDHTCDYETTEITSTCTSIGDWTQTCTICGRTLVSAYPALGHYYTSEVTKEPTPTEVGVRTFTCERCGDSYTEDVLSVFGTVTMGTCGENVTWTFDSATGELRIWGSGEMRFKRVGGHRVWNVVVPWKTFGDQITIITIEDGVTSIDSEAFFHCSLITSIIIPASVTKVQESFPGSLNTVVFMGDAPSFGIYAFEYRTVTAYYPAENETWTEDTLQDYGGTVTWVAMSQSCSHTGETETRNAKAATCTEGGYTGDTYCLDCDAKFISGKKIAASGHVYDNNVDGTCNACSVKREEVEPRIVVHMFRMYNPNTGEHFYTGSEEERDNLIGHGWQYEGIGFTFPANTGAPVHRLFHPSTGEHLYTMDEAEKDRLMTEGWNYEGIAFNSAYDTEAVQHRLHNPNATVGAYHFTFSLEEKDMLIAAGWEYQGIGWYSCWK